MVVWAVDGGSMPGCNRAVDAREPQVRFEILHCYTPYITRVLLGLRIATQLEFFSKCQVWVRSHEP